MRSCDLPFDVDWLRAPHFARFKPDAQVRSSPDSTGEGRREASACSCSAAMPRSTKQHSRTSKQSMRKTFQYPVVVRGSIPVEIEETDSNLLEVLTPESEHWRGLQLDPTDRLLIRRSLVRAQVEEPIKSKGYVAIRNHFLFAILESDPGCPISSTRRALTFSLAGRCLAKGDVVWFVPFTSICMPRLREDSNAFSNRLPLRTAPAGLRPCRHWRASKQSFISDASWPEAFF